MNNTLTNETTPEKWMKRFFTIWFGQAFSLIGSSLVGFALVWWMTTTTHRLLKSIKRILSSILDAVKQKQEADSPATVGLWYASCFLFEWLVAGG